MHFPQPIALIRALTGAALGCMVLVPLQPAWSAPAVQAQPSAATDPAVIAQRIGDRVIADTVFRLEPKAASGLQQGFYPINVAPGDRGASLLFAANIRCSAACSSTPIDLRYAASPGELRFLIDGREVFRTRVQRTIEPHERDYNVVDAPIALRNALATNPRQLVILFRPSTGNAFVMPGLTIANGEGAQGIVTLERPGTVAADTTVRFLRTGLAAESDLGAALANLDHPRWQPLPVVEVMDNPDPLDMSDWRYFSGALQSAMLATGDRFKRPDFQAYVGRHARFFLDNIDRVAAERAAKHQLDGPFAHFFRFTLLDDIGPQTAALSEWNARQPRNLRLQRVESIKTAAVRAILNVPRLPDGTMARIIPVNRTVWADDLFMGAASLARIAAVDKRPDLLNEAARQAALFDRHLRDPATGLYYHGWLEKPGGPSSSKWARANGWTMLAKLQILKSLPAGHRARPELLRIFADHARALAKVQGADGRWHQVLDNRQTYLETSATAMFVAAMAEGVTRGWLRPEEFDATIDRGWRALASQVKADGRVEGIVAGTPILPDDAAYEKQKTRLSDPRGLPAVLYAAIAMADWNDSRADGSAKGK